MNTSFSHPSGNRAVLELPQRFAAARQTDLENQVFTIVGVATTGLESDDKIIEVGAAKYQGGQKIAEFSQLVKPLGKISEEIARLTGINNAMVATAAPVKQALRQLADFVGEAPVLVGHNTQFYLRKIRRDLKKAGLDNLLERFTPKQTVCTKTLGHKLFPEEASSRRNHLMTLLGLTPKTPMRALSVIEDTASLFQGMQTLLQSRGITTLKQLLAFQGKAFGS